LRGALKKNPRVFSSSYWGAHGSITRSEAVAATWLGPLAPNLEAVAPSWLAPQTLESGDQQLCHHSLLQGEPQHLWVGGRCPFGGHRAV